MSAQAVVLGAERALRAGEAGDPSVEPVEHHGDEDRDRRLVEAQVHRLHDRVEAGEQRGRREQIRQKIDAAPPDPVLLQRALGVEIRHVGAKVAQTADDPCARRGARAGSRVSRS